MRHPVLDARVVHQHVDRADLGLDRGDGRDDLVLGGDVERGGVHAVLAVPGREIGAGRVETGAVHAVQHDGGPGRGEPVGQAAADAAAGAGDQGDASGEVECRGGHRRGHQRSSSTSVVSPLAASTAVRPETVSGVSPSR